MSEGLPFIDLKVLTNADVLRALLDAATVDGMVQDMALPRIRFTFHLVEFEILTTRARDDDTDHVSIGLKVGDRVFDPQVKHMGDVDDGHHQVDLRFTDVQVPDLNTPVIFNYAIINNGSDDQRKIESDLKEAAIKLAGFAFASGSVWLTVATAVINLLGAILGDCDGPCAVDQVNFTGLSLWNLTREEGHAHTETRFYTIPSQTGCGDSPRYRVTWRITASQ